jgi:hypothetical protein
MSSHTHAAHVMTHGMSTDSNLRSSSRDMPADIAQEERSYAVSGTGVEVAGNSFSTTPAATTGTSMLPASSDLITDTSSYRTSSMGPVPGAGADIAGGSSRAIPAAATVAPTEGLMVGAIEHPAGTVEGQGTSLDAAAVGLVGAGGAGAPGSVAAGRAADLNVGSGSSSSRTMPGSSSTAASGSISSTTPAATEIPATTVSGVRGGMATDTGTYQINNMGPMPGAGADIPGGSSGPIPAAAVVTPTDGLLLGISRHGGSSTGGQGVSLSEAAAVGTAELAGAGNTGDVMPARAADLNVGRGILSTAATGVTEGAAGKQGDLKRVDTSSSSSSSSSGDEGERDTLTRRDQATVGFGADVHTALDTPMPTPASLVPPSGTISAPMSAMSAAGPGAMSAPGASSGPGVSISNSADVEAMRMRAMLPSESGRGADLMVGSGVQPVSQGTSDWQQQQQQVGSEGSERMTGSWTAATPSSRSSGRGGGGLIASIKGMLGVGQPTAEQVS